MPVVRTYKAPASELIRAERLPPRSRFLVGTQTWPCEFARGIKGCPTEADAPRMATLNSCWCVCAIARHNHTSTTCGSSSGGASTGSSPGTSSARGFARPSTTLSDRLVAGPVKIFRDDDLPRDVFARTVFRVLVHRPHDQGRHRFTLTVGWKNSASISIRACLSFPEDDRNRKRRRLRSKGRSALFRRWG